MFDLNQFAGGGKRLNGEFLKTLPNMALKATIRGGGVKSFDDPVKGKQDVPYLTLTSSAFDGEKELSLNATNRNILGAVYGKQAGAWIGKEIGVYFDPAVTFGGKAVGGVKVKAFTPDPFASSTPTPSAAPAEEAMPF
jgi:hypothetical protein